MAKFVDTFSDLKELGIDCEEPNGSLTEIFNKAANHLQSLLPNVDNQTLLTLYGYYKQGSEGACNISKPSWYDIRAKSKWEVWNKLGNMPPAEAKSLYIQTIKKLDPSFDDSASKEYWVKVSCMRNKEIVQESDKTLVDYIKEGNVKNIKYYLESISEQKDLLNKIDGDGLAPIHWAADSGLSEVVEVLIDMGADVNLQDEDGQTPLHYAASCGHIACLKVLLQLGGKADVVDNEGRTPLSVASDESVKELLSN